jgi:hypothetical protein
MEGQQQHVEDDYCVGSYTLLDILQAAPRLAKLLPPQDCKMLAASCTSMRSWYRARVTVIRLTDSKDMALLQPQHWPRLVTVMLDSTSDRRLSGFNRIHFKQCLPATWTQHASIYLGAGCHDEGEAPMCNSPPIVTIVVLIQPAGLQIQQHLLARVLQQDYRPGVYTLKNLMRKAASYLKDMVIAGDLCAPITEMFAQHRWPGLTHVMMVGSGTIDADVVFHLGQFVPQSTRMLQCAHCHLAPEAFGSLSDKCLSGLRFLNLSDCSLVVRCYALLEQGSLV